MREMLRVMLLGWLTAVLVAAPVVAALDCRACCSERETTRPAPLAKSCCAAHAAVAAPDDDCSHCPRCETSRPDPVTLPQAAPELLPLTALFLGELPHAVDLRWLATPAAQVSAVPIAASPPIRVRFCCWLT